MSIHLNLSIVLGVPVLTSIWRELNISSATNQFGTNTKNICNLSRPDKKKKRFRQTNSGLRATRTSKVTSIGAKRRFSRN